MSDFFTPNTGNAKMDKAYENIQGHINKCKNFDDFFMHFKYIVKTDDPEVLNKWLLKVLFVNIKYDKHDFEKLLDSVSESKKKELRDWLETSLQKQNVN